MTERSAWANPDFHSGFTQTMDQVSRTDSFANLNTPSALSDPAGWVTKEDVHLNLIAMRNHLMRVCPGADFRPTFYFVRVAPQITVAEIAQHVLDMALLLIEKHLCDCPDLMPRVERLTRCRYCLARVKEHVRAFLRSMKTYNFTGSLKEIYDKLAEFTDISPRHT